MSNSLIRAIRAVLMTVSVLLAAWAVLGVVFGVESCTSMTLESCLECLTAAVLARWADEFAANFRDSAGDD